MKGFFSRHDFIRSIRYRDTIRNQRYLNVRMYRIFEYYDVYISYFRLSYDILFNIIKMIFLKQNKKLQ